MASFGADKCTGNETFGLRELYTQLHTGPGVTVVTPASDGLKKFAPLLSGAGERIQREISSTGQTWQGQAAESAAAAMTQLGAWANKGSQAGSVGGGQVQAYADSFVNLKNAVAAPVPVPPLTDLDQVREFFGMSTDHSVAIKRNQDAAAAAIAALRHHESTTTGAINAFADPGDVPQVTNSATASLTGSPGGAGQPPSGGGASMPPGGGGGAEPSAGGGPAGAGGGGAGDSGGGSKGGGMPVPPGHTGISSSTPPPPSPLIPPVGSGGAVPHSGTAPGGGPGGITAPAGGYTPAHRPAPVRPGYRSGAPAVRPLAARGEEMLGQRPGYGAGVAEPAGSGASGRPAGPGAMPMGGPGGAGVRGEGREHRNNTFIPDDSPFKIPDEELDYVPAVIDAEYLLRFQRGC
ncbi:PPE domain-containing protein [Pseudonocardia spinosispora]|uniref:PPE domain-containing protein n=1 Tax=Pseudonocardia spinosispora TaxID=103441 RepID=UPI00041563B9|nr:PPE domain-containing protein [Pseudonocardia spinosispora]